MQPNVHWRAPSVSAASFVELCEKNAMSCVGQELINWGGGLHLIDAMSGRDPSGFALGPSQPGGEEPVVASRGSSCPSVGGGLRRLVDAFGLT
jgi:hypothetical protein